MQIIQTWSSASDDCDIMVTEHALSDGSHVFNVETFNNAHSHVLARAFDKSHAIECAQKIVAACLAAS